MGRPRKQTDESIPSSRPATTPEAQENTLIALAVELAERQLREGTASTQVINHFLKLATMREAAEREKLALENQLLKAKTDQITSQARSETMYKEAIDAFRMYSGQDVGDPDEDL